MGLFSGDPVVETRAWHGWGPTPDQETHSLNGVLCRKKKKKKKKLFLKKVGGVKSLIGKHSKEERGNQFYVSSHTTMSTLTSWIESMSGLPVHHQL